MQEPAPGDAVERPACRNCSSELVGEYCAACGQRARGRIELGEVAGEFVKAIVDWESAFWKTLKGLTVRPGSVAEEYVGGRRRAYVNPAKYYLVAVAIQVLLLSLFIEAGETAEQVELPPAASAVGGMAAEDVQAMVAELGRLAVTNLKIFQVVFMPLSVILLRALFRRSGYNAGEVLCFTLFVEGQALLFMGVLVAPLIVVDARALENVMGALTGALALAYQVWATWRFFRTSVIAALGANLLIVLARGIIQLLAIGGSAFVAAWLAG